MSRHRIATARCVLPHRHAQAPGVHLMEEGPDEQAAKHAMRGLRLDPGTDTR